MNSLVVVSLYLLFYSLFALVGCWTAQRLYPISRTVSVTITPLIGFSLFAVISTGIMFFVEGRIAGRSGLATCLILFLFVPVIGGWRTNRSSLHQFLKVHALGLVAGLTFLLPLIIANDTGLFAINGADFGSYAGWGKFFQDYNLNTPLAKVPPINMTQAAFGNLLEELTKAGGRWRVGNVSVFAAMASLAPAKWWATLYSVSIAFFFGQFALATRFFTRWILMQNRWIAERTGYAAILLNTVFWLGASHYTPNLMGLAITIFLVPLLLLKSRYFLRQAVLISIILALLVLVYPESYLFFPAILVPQLLMRDLIIRKPFFEHSRFWRSFRLGLAAFLLCALWTCFSIPICLRHLIGIMSYSRPGDYVGIFHWGYPSQALGFADYNSLLAHKGRTWLRPLVYCLYISTAVIIGVGLALKPISNRESLQKRILIVLLCTLLIFLIPIIRYFEIQQLLLGWRASITLSPYVWVILCVLGLISWQRSKTNKLAYLSALGFSVLIAGSVFFRAYEIRHLFDGDSDSGIFGSAFQRSTDFLVENKQKYDIAFIDYQGSGTTQGGWEFYSQDLSYAFPGHGVGFNEYSTEPLEDKRVVIVQDNYRKIQKLVGLPESGDVFGDRKVFFSDRDSILLPYSSTWIFSDSPHYTYLIGLAGKLLLWLQKDTNGCFNFQTSTNRKDAVGFRVSGTAVTSRTVQVYPEGTKTDDLCGHFKKGLNSLRIEPIVLEKNSLEDQVKFVNELNRLPVEQVTELQRGLIAIYQKKFHELSPLISPKVRDWGSGWNIIMPPDVYPLNPYIIFNSIRFEARP